MDHNEALSLLDVAQHSMPVGFLTTDSPEPNCRIYHTIRSVITAKVLSLPVVEENYDQASGGSLCVPCFVFFRQCLIQGGGSWWKEGRHIIPNPRMGTYGDGAC